MLKTACLGIVVGVAWFISCAKSPDQLTPVIDLTTNAANIDPIKSTITEFVFMVRDIPQTAVDFFPPNCLAQNNTCIPAVGCGTYSSSTATFELSPRLSAFQNGEQVELIVCGLDSAQNPVIAGSVIFENTKGESPAAVMDVVANDNSCSFIPGPC